MRHGTVRQEQAGGIPPGGGRFAHDTTGCPIADDVLGSGSARPRKALIPGGIAGAWPDGRVDLGVDGRVGWAVASRGHKLAAEERPDSRGQGAG